MSTLMMPAATMTTMTNTAPIAVTQPGKAGNGLQQPPQAAPAGVVAGSNGQPGVAQAAVASADPAAVKMGLINSNCNKSQQGKNQERSFFPKRQIELHSRLCKLSYVSSPILPGQRGAR